jgi:hypothetical protein
VRSGGVIEVVHIARRRAWQQRAGRSRCHFAVVLKHSQQETRRGLWIGPATANALSAVNSNSGVACRLPKLAGGEGRCLKDADDRRSAVRRVSHVDVGVCVHRHIHSSIVHIPNFT